MVCNAPLQRILTRNVLFQNAFQSFAGNHNFCWVYVAKRCKALQRPLSGAALQRAATPPLQRATYCFKTLFKLRCGNHNFCWVYVASLHPPLGVQRATPRCKTLLQRFATRNVYPNKNMVSATMQRIPLFFYGY